MKTFKGKSSIRLGYNEDISKGKGQDEIFSDNIVVIELFKAEFLPRTEVLFIEFSQC